MKKTLWISLITLLLLSTVEADGQRWKLRRYEVDLYLAGSAFHGDIGLANKPLANMFNGFRPNLGITPRFMVQQNLAVALDLSYHMYGGKDEEGSSHSRLYSFNSHAFVHGIRAEYYILGSGRSMFSGAVYNRRGMVNNYNTFNIYLFGGVSGIVSKSTVKDLRNDGEEPLDNPGYNNNVLYSAVFPVGAGLKYSLDARWSLGLEMGYAFSTSDLLDGYASEYSDYNDSYYIISVRGIYKIRNNRNGRPIFKRLYR